MFLSNTRAFELPPADKSAFLAGQFAELLDHHRQRCPGYARLVDDWEQHRNGTGNVIENYPFVPVTAFKEFTLKSTSEPVSAVRSSATSTGTSSNILVDRATKKRQTLSATKILTDFVGAAQRPYLVFDIEETVRGTDSLGARGAAILSLAHLASEFMFVMREVDGRLQLDAEAFQAALAKINGGPFLCYGFTFLLYQAHQELAQMGIALPAAHPDSVLLHSGGWKRMAEIAVSKESFNRTVAAQWALPPQSVLDFYGLVEQVGMLYPDCSAGHKHVPYWADVVIRRADTLAAAECGERGLIQLLSCLPLAAPNHSVLTEDLGRLIMADGCSCGRRGKAFVFEGARPALN